MSLSLNTFTFVVVHAIDKSVRLWTICFFREGRYRVANLVCIDTQHQALVSSPMSAGVVFKFATTNDVREVAQAISYSKLTMLVAREQ